jgi:hypothetical protein
MTTPKVKEAMEKYAAVREKRAELKKKYEEKDAVLIDALDKIEAFLMKYLAANDLQSVNAGVFTAYLAKEHKVGCADWNGFWQWMKETDRFMMEKRILVKGVAEYLEETGELPPFVNHSVERVVRVRRT